MRESDESTNVIILLVSAYSDVVRTMSTMRKVHFFVVFLLIKFIL